MRTIGALLATILGLAGMADAATPAIGAGNSHVLALHADGTVRAWGDDSQGQLGVGRTLQARAPAPVAALSNVASVAVGSNHVIALMRDGTMRAWGANKLGQLGDGSTTSRASPAPVTNVANVTQVSASGAFTLARDANGSVWSWGENYSGQLGRDDAGLVAERVAGLPFIVAVAAGGNHSVALDGAGGVWTWGRGDAGQLGDGAGENRTAPRQVTGLPTIAAIAAGGGHTIAVTVTGLVYAWGSNYSGQVGNGSPDDQRVPVQLAGLAGVTSAAAGIFHSLAVLNDGSLYAWGDGYGGQLGDGLRNPSNVPILVPNMRNVVEAGAGFFHSLARTNDGTVWTWGDNGAGQVGDGTTERRDAPYRVTSLPQMTGIGAGGNHSFAVTTEGRVYAWGSNEYGELGDGVRPLRTTPGTVIGASAITRVAGGGDHSLALRTDGTVLAWGGNGLGQLGDGTRQGRSTAAAAVVEGLGSVREISAGYYFSIALKSDGTAWSWGYNYGGQLGRRPDASVVENAEPIPGATNLVAISSGGSHTLALTNAGTVVAWGGNASGQLGDGTRVDRYAPVAVPGLSGIKAVAAGGTHSLALGVDGRVFSWGLNYSGELGDGTNDDRAVPAVVAGLTGIVAIAAGGAQSFAVRSDGSVVAWGANWISQLGDGSGLSQSRPVPVPRLSGIVAVSVGGSNGVALKSDGTVYGWGDNIDGRVGDGTLVTRDLPAIVVREDGAGTLERNDWFLDLDPAKPKAIALDVIPVFLVATQAGNDVVARLQFRAGDLGSSSSVFTFALAPVTLVKGAVAKGGDPRFARKAKASAGGKADAPVQCALAQLNAQGELIAVSADSLRAYVSGVLSAQGQAVTILNNVPASSVAGATFFVGYGPSGNAMLTNGTTRSVVSVAGSVDCRPQAPQTGWWWNPAEPGRGFAIEARGNRLFFAAFHYEADGRATWNFAGGVTSLDGSLFTADYYSAAGGQTLTGPYKPATLTRSATVTMAFSEAGHGTLIWPGGNTPIERLPFVPNGLTAPAQQGLPEAGWWWNPAENGRGFFIEWQNGTFHAAAFLYDPAGHSTWYLSAYPSPDPLRIAGNWWLYGNGQAPGAPHRSPTKVDENVAPLDIQFSNTTTATMTLPGGVRVPLVRMAF